MTAGSALATWAYLVDGELVICGRIKDLIIVGGRNVYREDVERAAASVDGVRAGNVIAFAVDGRKASSPCGGGRVPRRAMSTPLRQAVAGRIRDVVGLPPQEVVLVEPERCPRRPRASCSARCAVPATKRACSNPSERAADCHGGYTTIVAPVDDAAALPVHPSRYTTTFEEEPCARTAATPAAGTAPPSAA